MFDGKEKFFIASFKDITSTFSEPAILADTKGIILSVNSEIEKLFGYSSKDMVGRNLSVLMPQHHSKQHNEYISNYLSSGEKKLMWKPRILPIKRSDGRETSGNRLMLQKKMIQQRLKQ